MKNEYDFSHGKRGAVIPPQPGKTRITIRLDNEVLEWFREQAHAAGGGNYQSLINEALHQHIEKSRQPIEEIVRQVVRDEMARALAGQHDKIAV